MIDPRDDSYLMGKNAEANETFIVTKADKATLWRSAHAFPREAWIFEGSECYKPVFMAELQAGAQRAGFSVKFLQVRGPAGKRRVFPLPLELVSEDMARGKSWSLVTLPMTWG
jgi:hypothetical protein